MRTVRAIALTLAATAFLALAHAPRGPQVAGAVHGLDHVPVAVRDLEAAIARYASLGFTLKPGQPHANGIRNAHAKFADGTEIELITAPAAVDALTRTYRTHLAQGDGPAFLAFWATRPAETGDAIPPYIFFGQGNASPTDRPEHFQHANTASSLISVWLAGEDLSAERRVLHALGATTRPGTVDVPEPTRADIAVLPHGTVRLLPGTQQRIPGRRIVGLTVSVRDLEAAGEILGHRIARRSSTSIFLGPDVALGFWLELQQAERR